jgi:amphi-Trp domain-containing protein
MSRKLAFTTRLTRDDVAGLMEAMMDGLRNGLLKVHKSDETMEMPVPRVIDLEVRAALDKDRARCLMEVSWRPHREENPDVPDADEVPLTGETSARERAGASIREAARAAREMAGNAGRAMERTAHAAVVLAGEGAKKGRARIEAQNFGELFSRLSTRAEAAAGRAWRAVRGLSGKKRAGADAEEALSRRVVPEQTSAGPLAPAPSLSEEAVAARPQPEEATRPLPQNAPATPVFLETSAQERDLPQKVAAEPSPPDKAATEPQPEAEAAPPKASAPSRAKTPALEKTTGKSPEAGARKSRTGKAKPEE